jgi:hypothetical protein
LFNIVYLIKLRYFLRHLGKMSRERAEKRREKIGGCRNEGYEKTLG